MLLEFGKKIKRYFVERTSKYETSLTSTLGFWVPTVAPRAGMDCWTECKNSQFEQLTECTLCRH